MNNKKIEVSKYNPHIHHRRSIRLKGYDYSQAGLYFVTICCKDRACLFGEIVVDFRGKFDGSHEGIYEGNYKELPVRPEMKLNDAGKMVESEWLKLAKRFENVVLH